jgi:glucose/mannose-6-phosphate isomerase
MAGTVDDPREIQKHDGQGMLNILKQFDYQLEEALEIGLKAGLPEQTSSLQNILVCGLGGSAIGGDFLRAYLGTSLKVPLLVNRNYSIPGFANDSTLTFVCSYSGNTEETISALRESEKAGCRVICLTSDGQLKELAKQQGHPCLLLPGGFPPRTALGYSAVPMLVVLSRLGLIPDCCNEIRRSLPWVRTCTELYGEESPAEKNVAKKLALQVHHKIPIVYGSQDRLEMVAVRWRGQFSENAKQLAYCGVLPEMNHNEIAGWRHPDASFQHLIPIFLRDREDHPRVQIRAEITRQLVSEKSGAFLEYWSEGESWLERLWALILLGDYASIYLAFLNKENPTPVEAIESLKQRLQEYGQE